MEGKVERNLKGFRKLLVYKLTDELHKSEIYGVTSQVRRAVSFKCPRILLRGMETAKAQMQWSKAVPRSPATLVAGECHQSESLRAETGYLLYRLEQSLKKST